MTKSYFCTSAFLDARKKDPEGVGAFMENAFSHLSRNNLGQPSMAFGSPKNKLPVLDDETEMNDGSVQFLSVKLPAPQELWLKRDDLPDGPIYTFLLPQDY